MKALNRAFEKAFAHTGEEDTIEDLLSCMGEEMGCDRISIFEENEEGILDNTYEWCRPGVVHEQILMQHIEIDSFRRWYDRLVAEGVLILNSTEELRHDAPVLLPLVCDSAESSSMVAQLSFHGKNLGFCLLENPDPMVLADEELIMPGIRYILSSLLFSGHLVSRLRRLGYTDSLTGVGNRISMQECLETMDLSKSLGVICLDVIGWDNKEGKLPHLEKEHTLLRASDILRDLFDERHVFRTASGVFIILESGIEKSIFEQDMRSIRGLFHKYNLMAAVSEQWVAEVCDSLEEMIHSVQQETEEEKRKLLTHRDPGKRDGVSDEDGYPKANISLPRGDEFFRLADLFLAANFEESILSVVTDINYFNLYNDIFGRKAGNVFLENIGAILREHAAANKGICGYIGGDNFCLLIPTRCKEAAELVPFIEKMYESLKFPDGFSPAMGVYLSSDRRETVISLYDRALSALAEIKGDYLKHFRFYTAEMHSHQKEDKLLLMDVRKGLETGEFLFYIQPQVNDKTGKIIGGEALVRWFHNGELISPARFVPILEKTGYIYAVDTFVWESVVKWQREMLDRGIQSVPISVNVSRVDFYFGDIAKYFIDLVKTYHLNPGLIGIEITESAFTDNTDMILEAIRKLHEAGFHILMDDFGSGSSSLSMLHTMDLDVLKTDVQFMSKDKQDNRAISIVESVISMAHMIGMNVVTEGVETEKQKESLIALGDNFAQGYYFYKPMPKESFFELIRDPACIAEGYRRNHISAASQLRFREMIREGLVSETLLNNIIRAAAVYKEQNGKISIVQINDLFTSITGIRPNEEEMSRFEEHIEEAELQKFRALMKQADSHPLGGSEGTIVFTRSSGERVTVRIRVFLLYSYDDHHIYLSAMA